MDITTPFLSVTQLALVPLVMAVVSVLKTVGITGSTANPHRFAPLLSLVFGVASAFLLPSETTQFTLLAGLTIGCIAAGVYSGVKTTVN